MVRLFPWSIEDAVGFHHVIHNIAFGNLKERERENNCKLIKDEVKLSELALTVLTSFDLNCFGAERFLPSLLPRWL